MSESRIKISFIVENQLPDYVKEEFPLVSEFLSKYYQSIESQGNVLDILQNIDRYVKVDNLTNLVDSTQTTSSVSLFDTTINVKSTNGFPNSYGLIKIGNEIITYESKTSTSFTQCIRGFVGIEEYLNNDQLKFSDTNTESHSEGSSVQNLSILFLKQFFNKVKTQVTPGFENRQLDSQINEALFVKQSNDFYSSKGTAHSFEILFRALYGKDVDVILPRDYLIQPSDAQYRITRDLVVESIEGNPTDLVNLTLYQDSVYNIPQSRGTISNVERIVRGDKDYYVISLDYGYDNLNEIGLTLGEFTIHPKTRNILDVTSGADTLTVDSTVGFPSSGVLTVNLKNGTKLSINYKSKSSTQFYDCSGINQNIPKNSELNLDVFAYGYINSEKTKIVKVRVTGVLSNVNLDTPSRYYSKGDLIKIRTLGKKTKDFKANKWLFNVSSTYNIKSVDELDSLNFKYLINLHDDHLFYLGDSVTIIPPQAQPVSEVNGVISAIKNSKSIVVSTEVKLDLFTPFRIRKNVVNVSSSNNLNLNKYTANIQNTYLDNNGSVYVASPSLPHYADSILNIRDKKVIFSGTFSGDTLTIPNHKFHTGDEIVYNPNDTNNKLNLDPGKYVVRRVDSNRIKISRSLSDIFTENYINVSGTVTNNIFYYEPFTFENLTPKVVQSQKLIRQISEPVNAGLNTKTPSGFTGIFINGVELLNYKSNDYVYYGPINEIDVISNGSNYDVINPPVLQISDKIGFGATAYCTVNGSLSRVDIIDGGVNYLETPRVIISGGNGFGAEVVPNLESYDYVISFNSRQSAEYVDLSNNTIGFSSFHKLTNGEELIYQTNGQNGIGGITTDTSYFISVVDATTIKLHNKLNDALNKINEVNLTLPYGDGIQNFKSKSKKRRIQSLTVVNPGSNYRNRRLSTNPVGINTANNSININNHNFNNKDIVSYETTESPILGLDTSKLYYVKKIDNNNFRLFDQYTIDDDRSIDFYYETNQPVNLESIGSGFHIFRDEPIKIKVIGSVGVTTFSNQTIDAFVGQLQPIFRGSIESVFVESGGSNYGSQDIINLNRQPEFLLNSGVGAELRPIIIDGSIVEVFVVSSGTGYNCPPDLVIESPTGFGAVLTPIVDQGLLVSVKVVSGGAGYQQLTTSIDVLSAGLGAKFNADIKSWNINVVERNLSTGEISDDDGIISAGLNNNFGLEYSHGYAPRNLRRSAFSEKFVDGEPIYVPDLNIENGKESLSDSHSPIIGWAYDGNPIYGPYGYSNPNGGVAKLLKSGYSILLQDNRPSLELYPEGFFVEDYDYIGNGDLDQSNGRFCVTPEYPNGTYAYFATVSDIVETSGIFANYRKPTFPYVIGDHYHSSIIPFNFLPLSNQDDFDLNKTNLLRNTTPYYLDSDNSFYEFIENPNKIKEQNSKVTSNLSGSITSIDIVNSGNNYSVGDQIIFDNENTGGRGSKAYISSIEGEKIVGISITTTQINDVELTQNIGISSIQLNEFGLKDGDFLTIQGKFPNQFNTTQRVNIINNKLILSSGIGSAGYTGISTFISVYSPINASVNDLFHLGNEIVKILNIDIKNSRVRILRNQNGTSGVSSYSAGYALTESPTKFSYNSNDLDVTFRNNDQLYFDPRESIGIGSTSGVGVGVTLYFSNPGSGSTSLFVPTRAIYIPNHEIENGTELLYNSNGGDSISISTDGISSFVLEDNSIIYSTKISEDLIGISTVPVYLNSNGNFVGIGSTNIGSLLYFTGIGTFGSYHSFKLNPTKKVIADISKNSVNVSTAETHGIKVGENISITISPKSSTNLSIHYDDHNRRLYTNPLTFSSNDVDVVSNTITINDHNLITGQSVIYQEIESVGGLTKNKIHYVINYGKNSIKLAASLYDISINKVLDITSTGSGIISPVNPRIVVTKNNTVNFDLSSSTLSFTNNNVTYSAFDFKVYKNSNFTEEFSKVDGSSKFNIIKTGRIGIDTNASVSLTFDNQFPDKLYYRLEPKNTSLLPQSKKQIIFDSELIGSGEIVFVDSILSGLISISGVGSTSFEYTISSAPPEKTYDTTSGVFEYEKFSGKGKIKKIYLESGGSNYRTLPNISQILSSEGSGALLYPNGDKIGSANNIKIEDIGFSYTQDLTLRPSAKLPDVLKLYSLSVFDRIGISSRGVNYIIPPDLVVIDGKTNKQITDVDISYGIDDSEVSINRNVKGIYDVNPTIIPINNTNSIEIKSIVYNSVNKNVTIYLSPSYSSIEDFPFDVGEKILIEGSSVDESSPTVKGYNSENYGYSLFTIVSVDPNIGGSNGSITYNLSEYLLDGESPGIPTVDGFVVPQRYFPIFNISLKKLQFRVGEIVSSNSSSGTVQLWDYKNNNLKVSTNKDFVLGEIITGESSGASAVIEKIYGSDASYAVGPYSIVRNGWFKETGFLNRDTQRIQDSDYYQYFSYSLKSEVPIDKWDESVGSLNHTAGFKRFGDLVINSKPGLVGLSTNQDKSKFIGIADLYSVKSLNCFDDFDLVYENYKKINRKHYSDQIIFNSKILQDYIESIGNRVLKVDDISSQFNSNPRATRFAIVDRFNINECRSKKYIIYISDVELYNDRESVIVTLTHDGVNGYLNQYARVESSRDLGYFDFRIVGNEAQLLFYPIRYRFSNYDIKFLSFGIRDNIDSTKDYSLGDTLKIESHTSTIASGISSTTIVGISSDFRSSKLLVQVATTDKDYFEFNEINIIRGDNDVYYTEYGEITSGNYLPYSTDSVGTYFLYLDGDGIRVDFNLNEQSSKNYFINSISVSLSDESFTGIGSTMIGGSLVRSNVTSIPQSPNPEKTVVYEHNLNYNSSYYLISVEDLTNNRYQISEILVTNDDSNSYIVEYGVIETDVQLGTFDSTITNGITNLTFTPLENISCEVRVLAINNALGKINGEIDFLNALIESGYAYYEGTEVKVKRDFELNYEQLPIFERSFDGSNSSIVNLEDNTIHIANHNFVTGEQVEYKFNDGPIGIETTFVAGLGVTDKLPKDVYIVKINDLKFSLSTSAENSLSGTPNIINITSVGIGTTHRFTSKKQNTKSLVTIDNVIQSPITALDITTTLNRNVDEFDEFIVVSGISSFFTGDIIKIDDEIMKIESIQSGERSSISIVRPWMGTSRSSHSIGSTVTKLKGDYNIVGNIISFVSAPYGNVPEENPELFDETDYTGLSTSSTFTGRIFLRSGVENSSSETYHKNYIFDDISNQFNGISTQFKLTSNYTDITGISTNNAIVLVNEIFQLPSKLGGSAQIIGNYDLREQNQSTTIFFNENSEGYLENDINASKLPRGGIILSVGSSHGFGYQPLVSAAGTAIITNTGLIESISIGNSGSGYRSGYQVVNVSVGTSSVYGDNITNIGTAQIENGHITSVSITNRGSGFSKINPPYVIFDAPLSYTNIPLIYSNSSNSGVGTDCFVDIVVGNGSSVINFEIKNYGHKYLPNDILTIPTNSIISIPTYTNSSFQEFQIIVERTLNDKFSGWAFGELQVLDSIANLFDGERKEFPILIDGQQISIRTKYGSKIDVEQNLLIFINDVLQVPGEGYSFNGGSVIRFSEPPNIGDDVKILFYRGTTDVDTVFVDIRELIEPGDTLQINSDDLYLKQDKRLAKEIVSTDIVRTNNYSGPGLSDDSSNLRPVTLCKLLTDTIIDGQSVTKDRLQYESKIYPVTNIIQNVSIGSTEIFVESVKTFFDSVDEYLQDGTSEKPQKSITLTSQDNVVGASATAIVSSSGNIIDIVINESGSGYTNSPLVTIASPVGIGTTFATALATVINGKIAHISITYSGEGYSIENPPEILIEPPTFNYETIDDVTYEGDFGIISGVSTTIVGSGLSALNLSLLIPEESFLRDSQITNPIIGVSGLTTGYYFVVNNSNVGNGIISLNNDRSILSIGSSFIDNVYQVYSSEIIINEITESISIFDSVIYNSPTTINDEIVVTVEDTGVLTISELVELKVTTLIDTLDGLENLNGDQDYFGDYSWGKINANKRKNPKQFNFYPNGTIGISTTSVISFDSSLQSFDSTENIFNSDYSRDPLSRSAVVRRTSPLKYNNYVQ